jgi:hypothetical protein
MSGAASRMLEEGAHDRALLTSLTGRVILHIDMDAFYAQVEHERTGIARHEPLAVQQWDGLIAVNYVARAKGVSRHMRVREAKKLCPELHLVHVEIIYGDTATAEILSLEPSLVDANESCGANAAADVGADVPVGAESTQEERRKGKVSLQRYRNASAQVFDALAPFGVVEKASIDEAYIDVTQRVDAMRLNLSVSDAALHASSYHSRGDWEQDEAPQDVTQVVPWPHSSEGKSLVIPHLLYWYKSTCFIRCAKTDSEGSEKKK